MFPSDCGKVTNCSVFKLMRPVVYADIPCVPCVQKSRALLS